MRRAPFVVAATGAGLGLLLSYHTRPLASPKASEVTQATLPTTTTTAPAGGASEGTSSTSTGRTTTTTAPAEQTATGEDVEYRYGDIQLGVTARGSTIESVRVVSNGADDPRSQQINEEAVPQLEQEAISAQSADIDGVSGATYTSLAFAQALQSALDQLRS